MKLKTEQFEKAYSHLDHALDLAINSRHYALEWCEEYDWIKDAAHKIYTQAQQDLAESASGGFEEWAKKQPAYPFSAYDTMVLLEIWQASRISMLKENKASEERYYEIKDRLLESRKENEELKTVILNQEKERQRSEAFWKDKLISLQEEVAWAESKLKEAKEDIKKVVAQVRHSDGNFLLYYGDLPKIINKWEIEG